LVIETIAVCLIKLPTSSAFCYIGNRAIVLDNKVTEMVTRIRYQRAGIVNVFQVVCQDLVDESCRFIINAGSLGNGR
jgi:competence transcription factor ComK